MPLSTFWCFSLENFLCFSVVSKGENYISSATGIFFPSAFFRRFFLLCCYIGVAHTQKAFREISWRQIVTIFILFFFVIYVFMFLFSRAAASTKAVPGNETKAEERRNVESILSRKHTKSMKHVKCFSFRLASSYEGFID